MTKEEILNYVMNTPENTNRMVLNDMLDKLVNSSGSGSDIFDVLFTLGTDEETGDGMVTCDQTFEEVAAAINAGKSLRAKLADSDWPSDGAIYDLSTLIYFSEGNVDYMQFFTFSEVTQYGVTQASIKWTSYYGLELIHGEYYGPETEPDPGSVV